MIAAVYNLVYPGVLASCACNTRAVSTSSARQWRAMQIQIVRAFAEGNLPAFRHGALRVDVAGVDDDSLQQPDGPVSATGDAGVPEGAARSLVPRPPTLSWVLSMPGRRQLGPGSSRPDAAGVGAGRGGGPGLLRRRWGRAGAGGQAVAVVL